MGDADVAKAALRFPLAHGRELRLEIDQIVHLHEVDPLGLEPRQGALHRIDSGLFTARPDLGREEQSLPNAKLRRKLSDHLFRAAVHWRRINHPATEFYEQRQHVAELFLAVGCKIDIKGLPRPESDHGQLFSGSWNRAYHHHLGW